MMTGLNKDSGIQTSTKTQRTTAYNASPSTVAFTATAERQYKTGVAIPNYHARRDRGELLPHTPFTQVEWSGRHVDGNVNAQAKSGPNWFDITNFKGSNAFPVSWRIDDFIDHDVDPTIPPPSAIPDYFVQQAAARIYSQGFDALTASAEAKKTVQGFKGVSKRMLDLARQFSTKKMLKLWLEGRYAWRTLAYDVRDLHSALTEFDAKREIWTERAGTSLTQSSSEEVGSYTATSTKGTLTKDTTHTWSLRGSVSGLIKPNRFVVDPVKTGWELVPYSFVVDWVYNVGVALDAMAFRRAASAWTASKGFKCDSIVTFTENIEDTSSWTSSGSVSYEYQGSRSVRSPVSSFPTLPQVTNRALTWDLSLDLQALASVRGSFR